MDNGKQNTERNVKGLIFFLLCALLTLIWLKECSVLSDEKQALNENSISRTTVSITNPTSPDKMKNYSFVYKFKKAIFKQDVFASSQEVAFKDGAKKCFQHFTQGKYPGEEVGLDIIDSCANPVKEDYSGK